MAVEQEQTSQTTMAATTRSRRSEAVVAEQVGGIASLQRSVGNRATATLLAVGQAKLSVGASDDRYEREADDVAAKVVRALASRTSAPAEGATDAPFEQAEVQRRIQRRAVVDERGGNLDAETESMISSARSGGQSLAPQVRRQMEGAIGADFSSVKVHSGAASDVLNNRVQASAFTIGNDIFFKGGMPDTSSAGGQELMAHELTHTVQQGAAVQRATAARVVSVDADLTVQRHDGPKKRRPRRRGKGKAGSTPVAEAEVEAEGLEEEAGETTEAVVEDPQKAQQEAAAAAEKLAQEQAAAAQAAAVTNAKALFESNSAMTFAKVTKARTDAAPNGRIDLTDLNADVAELTALNKQVDKQWVVMADLLKTIFDESVRVINMAALANQGRLSYWCNTIPAQKRTSVVGDKFRNEQAAVTEAVDAIEGNGTWRGTNGFGDTGKWGTRFGDGEGNLPLGSFLEYYVRAENGNRKFGLRRICKHVATGRLYYTWTHYGEQGDPPFVLLT